MASPAKDKAKSSPRFVPRGARPRPLWGVIFLILALLSLVAFVDYDPDQLPQHFNTRSEETNLVGAFGVYLCSYSYLVVGLAGWCFPMFSLWLSYLFFRGQGYVLSLPKWVSMIVFPVCMSVFASVLQQERMPDYDANTFPAGLGGAIGTHLYVNFLEDFLGTVGTLVVYIVFVIFLAFNLFYDNLLRDVGSLLWGGMVEAWDVVASMFAQQKKAKTDVQAVQNERHRAQIKELKAQLAEQKKQQKAQEKGGRPAERNGPILDEAPAPKAPAKAPEVTGFSPLPVVPDKKKPAAEPAKAPLLEPAVDKLETPPEEKKGLFGRKKKPDVPVEEDAAARPTPFTPFLEGADGEEMPAAAIDPAQALDVLDDLTPAAPVVPERPAPRSATAASPTRVETPPAMPAPVPTPRAATPAFPVEVPSAEGDSLKIIASEKTRRASEPLPDRKGDYRFPPRDLLTEPRDPEDHGDMEIHRETAEALKETLDQFNVKVELGEVHAGPVITRYDVHPAPGVRVEKIQNLDKNLALNLKALSVRILAPVPGKGCVGVEVPNKNPQAVYIRDILDSEDWAKTKAEIPIALGKEVSGRPLIADLTKMPHLLIAGSTGSGKTVCINAIITSLLYRATPDDLKFVMVDPKIVEMQVYNSLPHMLIPVVTDPKKVPNALRYLLTEMERRYQMFASVGVRNIAGFNGKMAKDKAERQEAEKRAAEMEAQMTPEERAALAERPISVTRQLDFADGGDLPERLPYIVCIVDELADLMMVAPADIETGIARLAQLARAAGIHLILATQRPSVNVITGVIKANLPSRIAFKVASKVDSRTILDTGGADQLIGKGDMLFLPPGSADLIRSQGAFVGDDEINGIVEWIKEQNGEPEFDEAFQRQMEVSDEEGSGDDEEEGDFGDNLTNKALAVIKAEKKASTSMLQRRLKIGYTRAARIMDELEEKGYVGPDNGPPVGREILFDVD